MFIKDTSYGKKLAYNNDYNQTDAFLDSMKKSRNNKKNRDIADVSVIEAVILNRTTFARILEPMKHVITSLKCASWDTENDGVGGSHKLADTRQWNFMGINDGIELCIERYTGTNTHNSHINRPNNPNYISDEVAKAKILEYISNYDYLIAFGSCDGNRLEELLGSDYHLVAHKLIDFYRQMLSPITSTTPSINKMYLPGLTQSDVVKALFLDNTKLESVFGPLLVSTTGFGKHQKCHQDVRELRNLVTIWRTVLYTDLKLLMDAPNGRCELLGPMAEIVADFLDVVASELRNKSLLSRALPIFVKSAWDLQVSQNLIGNP